jgi:hypothetical protein
VSKCWKQERSNWRRWPCSAKASSVWVHRTVRWCTGQCLVRQAGSGELAALGKKLTAYGYNSPDYPVCTGQCPVSQRSTGPTVGRAVRAGHVAEPTASRGHRTVSGAPTAPKRQRSASPNKERDPHRTVSGAPGWLRRTRCSREEINGVRL